MRKLLNPYSPVSAFLGMRGLDYGHLGSRAGIITNGLIGYWKFDEASGSVAIDSSGLGNNGTYNGTTSSTNVPSAITFGDPRSRSFNGSSDYVLTTNTQTQFASGQAQSWMAWANLSAAGSYPAIFSSASKAELRYNAATKKPEFLLIGGPITSPSAVNLNQWYHIAATVDASGNGILYVNGSSVVTGALTLTSLAAATQTIGSRSGSTLFLSGLIDEARVYNRALLPGEVSQIAHGSG